MKRKRKNRQVKDYILYENSFLRTLNREQRSQLDKKKTIVIPPIFLIENLRHGVFKRHALFDFKNTVNILDWSELVKMDLLEKTPPRGYGVFIETPLNSIYDKPESARVKMERLAATAVESMDDEAHMLKTSSPTLHRDNDLFLALCETHEAIADTELVREFNRTNRKICEINQFPFLPVASRKQNKNISDIRKTLNAYKAMNNINTLTKAADMVEKAFFQFLHPFELVLGLLEMQIISVTDTQWQQIIDRYKRENPPNLNVFAPYAADALRLLLTMDIFLKENPVNTLPKEVLRDYDYLYYVLYDNVTFVSADKAHKKFIEEIPFLNKVRDRFIYFDKQNEQTIKDGLKKLGIKD
ncbi:MAG: hypothetical protein OXM61_07300 [Candidatus Poribacteria bacterium]|nr:hypothetical protein [Candidatus Poribacteria bacterium]